MTHSDCAVCTDQIEHDAQRLCSVHRPNVTLKWDFWTSARNICFVTTSNEYCSNVVFLFYSFLGLTDWLILYGLFMPQKTRKRCHRFVSSSLASCSQEKNIHTRTRWVIDKAWTASILCNTWIPTLYISIHS